MTGVVCTSYKSGHEFFFYEKIASYAENAMMLMGYCSDEYWCRTFEFEYCKKPAYKVKGKNRNDLKK